MQGHVLVVQVLLVNKVHGLGRACTSCTISTSVQGTWPGTGHIGAWRGASIGAGYRQGAVGAGGGEEVHRQISLDLAQDKPPPLHPYSTSFNPPSTFSTFPNPFFQTAMMCQPHSSTDSTQCQTGYHPKSYPKRYWSFAAQLGLGHCSWIEKPPTPLHAIHSWYFTLSRVCTHYKSYRKLILNI